MAAFRYPLKRHIYLCLNLQLVGDWMLVLLERQGEVAVLTQFILLASLAGDYWPNYWLLPTFVAFSFLMNWEPDERSGSWNCLKRVWILESRDLAVKALFTKIDLISHESNSMYFGDSAIHTSNLMNSVCVIFTWLDFEEVASKSSLFQFTLETRAT